MFWKSHACGAAYSRQYASIVFYANDVQRQAALASRQRETEKRPISTEVLPVTHFWLAEDYHQKYYLQQDAVLMRDFQAMYPSLSDFVNSTAAARVNSCVAGHGDADSIRRDAALLGLSSRGTDELLASLRTMSR